jgi:shikimate kinase
MNITLIGMAGAGKSTIGMALAKELGYSFIDVDSLIEKKSGMPLQTLINTRGDLALINFEEKLVLELENELGKTDKCVISPGGSVIYSEKSMKHLKKMSKLVFLDPPFKSIVKRIPNAKERGIVGLGEKSLKEIFDERIVLYRRYADIIIKPQERDNIHMVVARIIRACFEEVT